MSWGRLDDGMLEHRKWLAIEAGHGPRVWADCLAVWTAALLYAHRAKTDGHVPSAWLARGTPLGRVAIKAADVLVEAGLFDVAEDGYEIHDFADYSLSKAERDRRAEATRDRVAKHRAKRAGNSGGNSGGNSVTGSMGNAVSNASPDPTRPDPTRSDQPEGVISDITGGATRPAGSAAPPGPSESLAVEADAIARAVGDAIRKTGRSAPPRCGNPADRVWVSLVPFVREEAARRHATTAEVRAQLAHGFAAHEYARSRGYSLKFLEEGPGEFLSASSQPSTFAHVTVSALEMIPEGDR